MVARNLLYSHRMYTWRPWVSAAVAAVALVAASALGAEDFGAPYAVDGNTLGLWHFDESPGGNTGFDATANGNHAVIDPNAVDPFGDGYGPLDPAETWGPGQFGQGLHTWLTSVPDHNIGTLIVAQDAPGQGNSSLFVSGDFSIEFWMNATATSPGSWEDYILTKGTGAPYNLRYDQNQLEFGWYSGSWQNVIDPTVIPLNAWHHVAITVDNTTVPGSSVLTFYIDGELTSQQTVNPVQDLPGQADHNLYILGPDNGHPYNCFEGRLDELRISDTVRDYGEFPLDGNTLGLWHFDEAAGGTTAFDATANGNDAVIDPNASAQGYGPLVPAQTWGPALFGNGLQTWLISEADHNLGTLIVAQDPPGQGNSFLFVSGDFSIEFWMNATATSPGSWEDYILSKGTGAPYNLRYDQNQLEFGWYSGSWQNVIDPTVIPLSEWHHVTITVDNTAVPGNSVLTFYIDGRLTSQQTVNPVQDLPGQADHNLYILGPDNGNPFNCFQGRLDELRISDTVRDVGDMHITDVEVNPNDLQIRFSSKKNDLYTLRRTEDLKAGPWEDRHRVVGNGFTTVAALPGAVVSNNAAYYQVVNGEKLFEDVTSSAGLSGIANFFGGAWGDFNNDGWTDLFAGAIRRNTAGTFSSLVVPALNSAIEWGGPWGDYNNDGFLDLFALGLVYPGPTVEMKLLRNNAGTSFIDDSSKLPALPITQVDAATWVDVNNDGYIDLYLGGGEVGGYQPDAILLNNSGMAFTVVWTSPPPHRPARGVVACDFDEDDDMDIYVSNYRLEPNLLWINNGSGSFTEQAATYGVAGDGGLGAWGHTIGSNWVDMNNDGRFDLFVGNFAHAPSYQDRPQFLINIGPGTYHFQDMSSVAGLQYRETYTNPGFGDFDNDGYQDLFYSCFANPSPDENVLYRNNGDGSFSELPSESFLYSNYQVAWADYDNDGDLDVLAGSKLLQNRCDIGHFLRVKLQGNGTTVNKAALGAQVRITTGGMTLTRQVDGSSGAHAGNQNDLRLHFGLHDNAGPVNVDIAWPDGSTQTVPNVSVDGTLSVVQ